jgi:cysteinyl-tRNA synthetase
MNSFLFTAVRDDDDHYRVPADSITRDGYGITHRMIESKTMAGLIAELNKSVPELGAFAADGQHHQFWLRTELNSEIKIPFRIGLGRVVDMITPPDVLTLFDSRNAARRAKDFKRADSIRDELKQRGWVIEDGKSGPRLKKAR